MNKGRIMSAIAIALLLTSILNLAGFTPIKDASATPQNKITLPFYTNFESGQAQGKVSSVDWKTGDFSSPVLNTRVASPAPPSDLGYEYGSLQLCAEGNFGSAYSYCYFNLFDATPASYYGTPIKLEEHTYISIWYCHTTNARCCMIDAQLYNNVTGQWWTLRDFNDGSGHHIVDQYNVRIHPAARKQDVVNAWSFSCFDLSMVYNNSPGNWYITKIWIAFDNDPTFGASVTGPAKTYFDILQITYGEADSKAEPLQAYGSPDTTGQISVSAVADSWGYAPPGSGYMYVLYLKVTIFSNSSSASGIYTADVPAASTVNISNSAGAGRFPPSGPYISGRNLASPDPSSKLKQWEMFACDGALLVLSCLPGAGTAIALVEMVEWLHELYGLVDAPSTYTYAWPHAVWWDENPSLAPSETMGQVYIQVPIEGSGVNSIPIDFRTEFWFWYWNGFYQVREFDKTVSLRLDLAWTTPDIDTANIPMSLGISSSLPGNTYPASADSWCESTSGWTVPCGSLTTNGDRKVGSWSLRLRNSYYDHYDDTYWGETYRTFSSTSANTYNTLVFWFKRDCSYNIALILYAPDSQNAFHWKGTLTPNRIPTTDWEEMQIPLGSIGETLGQWDKTGSADWNNLQGIHFVCADDGTSASGIWIDWLHFVSGYGTTSPAQGRYTYDIGESVAVTAQPFSNYVFDYWSLDGATVYGNPITVLMESNHNLQAHFLPPKTLTISTSTGGTTNPAPGTYTYSHGTSKIVYATPYYRCTFEYWILDGTQRYGSSITVLMTADHSLSAYFSGGSPGGGGCPYVYTWDGQNYVKDNNILPASEAGNGTDTYDYYKLEQPLVPLLNSPRTSIYSLQVREFEDEIDYIDQIKLLAIDHSRATSIAVTPEGEVVTYDSPISPLTCIDNEGISRLSEISTMNGDINDMSTFFQGYEGDSLLLNFGRISSTDAKLILRDDQKCADVCIEVQIPDPVDSWKTIAILNPRDFWSIEAVNLAAYVPENSDFLVRLLWTAPHRLDYVGLDTSSQTDITVASASPILAVHSTLGNVGPELRYDDDQCVKLVNSQQITLVFKLPTCTQNMCRDFVFYTNGYYYTTTP